MRKLLLLASIVGFLAVPAVPGRAADPASPTAYTALRTMGKSLGAETLGRVVELTGRNGMPQPSTWRIVILDGTHGTREVSVTGAQVTPGTVTREASSHPRAIRLPDLNLDSSGAFDAANDQARKAHVPFNSINYSLRVNPATGKPVWDLELSNNQGVHAASIRYAAHDGSLLSSSGLTPGQASTTHIPNLASSDHDTVQATQVPPSRGTSTTTTTTYTTGRISPPPREREDEEERGNPNPPPPSDGGFFSRAGRTLDHTTDTVGSAVTRAGHSVDSTMRRSGATVQRFFTGHSDLDNGVPKPD